MASFVVLVWSDGEPPQVFGTFRSAAKAGEAVVRWRQSQPGEGLRAAVLPVQAAAAMLPPKPPVVPSRPVNLSGRPLYVQPGPGRTQRSLRPPAAPHTPRHPSGPGGPSY